MCKILDELDTYVPAVPSTKTILIDGEEYEVDATKIHQILLFGDQLTVARICSASVIRCTTDTVLWRNLRGLFLQLLIGMQELFFRCELCTFSMFV